MPTPADLKNFGDGVRRIFSNWKLIEYSIAPLPANHESVALAVSKGWIPQQTAIALFGELPTIQPVRKKIYVLPSPNSDSDAIRRAVAKATGRLYLTI